MNRNSNYRFSFDKMLSLQGNTAPYMLYAYARIRRANARNVLHSYVLISTESGLRREERCVARSPSVRTLASCPCTSDALFMLDPPASNRTPWPPGRGSIQRRATEAGASAALRAEDLVRAEAPGTPSVVVLENCC